MVRLWWITAGQWRISSPAAFCCSCLVMRRAGGSAIGAYGIVRCQGSSWIGSGWIGRKGEWAGSITIGHLRERQVGGRSDW